MTIKMRVKKCVEANTDCLSSNSMLIIDFWSRFDSVAYNPETESYIIKRKNISKLTSPETITRGFRHLMNRGEKQ